MYTREGKDQLQDMTGQFGLVSVKTLVIIGGSKTKPGMVGIAFRGKAVRWSYVLMAIHEKVVARLDADLAGLVSMTFSYRRLRRKSKSSH